MSGVDPEESSPGWRGKRSRPAPALRYRWQKDPGDETADPFASRDLWRPAKIVGLLALTLALAAVLAYRLSYDPARTTFVTISAPAYSWPFPPLAWSGEEREAFQDLDNENLQVFDTSAAWESKERGLAQFDERLAEIVDRGGNEPVIIYVAMHGAVDGQGEPCLAPPGAAPLRADSWLRVAELLSHLAAAHLPDERPKLLVLDCGRVQVDWNLGVALNTFAAGLERRVEAARIPGLAVINSTSPGEVGTVSDDLASSVFGRYLRLGLAGAADFDRDSGNGDRRVSLRELHKYLTKNVDGWVAFNRSRRQRPQLITSDVEDFTLSWSFNHRRLRRMETLNPDAGMPAAAPPKLVALWRERDRLRAARAYQQDPIGYRNLEQKLVWLGQALRAGKAYAAPSQRVEAEIASSIAALDRRLRPPLSAERRGAALASGGGDRKSDAPVAHSISEGQFLGAIGPKTAARLRGYLSDFEQAPSRASGVSLLERFAPKALTALVEAQALRLFESYLPDDAWRDPAAIGRATALRESAESCACPNDARVQYFIRPNVEAGDVMRRAAVDRLFVGNRTEFEAFSAEAARAEQSYATASALGQSCSASLALHDQAAQELPYLAAWLSRPGVDKRAAAAADQQINHTLLQLVDANRRLGVALASAYSNLAAIDVDDAPWNGPRDDTQKYLDATHEILHNHVVKLADAAEAKAVVATELEAILRTPLLEATQWESLARKFASVGSRLNGDYHDPKRDKPEQTAAEQESLGDAGYLERVAVRWDEHPAIAILRRVDAPETPRKRAGSGDQWIQTVNDDGRRLRELLVSLAFDVRLWQNRQQPADHPASLGDEINNPAAPVAASRQAVAGQAAGAPSQRDLQSAANGAAGQGQPLSGAAVLDAREEWSEPARWVRQAASFWFPTLEADPVERLARFDAQQLMLWQAQRSLDDFLGPVDEQPDPFFVVAARDQLANVRALGATTGVVGQELERLESLLAVRRLAARGGLETTATDIVLTGGAGDVPIGIEVRPGAENAAAGLPPALAAVYLGDARGRIPGTNFALSLPLGGLAGSTIGDASGVQPLAPPALPLPAGPGPTQPQGITPRPAPALPNASEKPKPATPEQPKRSTPSDAPILPLRHNGPAERVDGLALPAPAVESPPLSQSTLNQSAPAPPVAGRPVPAPPKPAWPLLAPPGPALANERAETGVALPMAINHTTALAWSERFETPEDHFDGRGPLLDATALVRGNRFSANVLLRPTGGVKIDFTRYEYGPPSVAVLGRSRRRVAIEFILDCSHSMEEPTPIEEPGAAKRAPRMELAKTALEAMLDELAARGDAHVAVRFFGHRVGWNIKQPNQLLRQASYGRPSQDGLLPSEDVELVLPMGRYDGVIHGGMVELLKSVQAWGETPLYLSLIEALGDFANEDADSERSIVVITDGVNYQFNSPSPKSRDQVITAYNALPRKTPIHIVGFGIGEREAAEASRDFGEIAKRTQGSYVPVTSATALVRSLEALLGSKPFHLYDALDRVVAEAPVGSTIHLAAVPLQPERFSVRLGAAGAAIELAGGEAIELLPSRDGRRLESALYDKQSPTFAPLVLDPAGSSTGLELGAHRALWQADGVRFPFSFQHANHAFTARPAEVWIEVAPLMAEKRLGGSARRATSLAAVTARSQKYIFYDVNYLPATAAPVLDWLAADWPVEAQQAEIRVWAKPKVTPPNWRIPLTRLLDPADAPIGGRKLPGLDGVSYQVRLKRAPAGEGSQIAIVERHADDGPPLDALKFELSPAAARTIHRFDAEHRIVVHIFTLPAEGARSPADYELLVTRRDDVQSGAWRLEEPLVVNVTDPGDLLQLGAPKPAP